MVGDGRLAALLACVFVAAACDPGVKTTTAAFELTEIGSCRLGGVERLELIVAGDFPSRRTGQPSAREPLAIDALPIDARAVSIEARLTSGRDAAALAPLPAASEGGNAPLPLMPIDRSCPIGDTLIAAAPGAAVAATESGALLVAGGLADDASSLRAVVVLPRGTEFGSQVEGGLLLPRAYASATPIAGGVLIAGGAAGDAGPAHDTYEVYDEGAGRLLPPRLLEGGGRRNHGAARLPDGRVLLVGGASAGGGAPLGSAVLIDPAELETRALGGSLAQPRLDPSVLVLDDGSVLVLLGRLDQGDGADARVATAIEQLTGSRSEPYQRFERAAELPAARAVSAVAALEGGRVAWIGCVHPDDPDVEDPQGAACELALLVRGDDGELAWVRDAVPATALEDAGVRALEVARLTALRDGKLLLSGRRGSAPRAWLVDLARGTLSAELAVEATLMPDPIVELADGTLAELDRFGTSLRRHDARSAFHDPPADLLSADQLVPDRPSRARFEDGEVAADGGALRLDLPLLRFGAVRVELQLRGPGGLLLEPAYAPALAVELDEDRVALGECELAHGGEGDAIAIERHGVELTLHAGGARRACRAPALEGLIGVALRLDDGSAVHALRVERR